ncbi:MAG: NAD(P)/FAD-dependent oxidoreductase [Sphingobacteriaceae bacterium]
MSNNQTNVNISFWELEQYFSKYDLIVIGSGIVGLFTALNYKMKNKAAKVLILERGILPYGASTKNAGFACFGSLSELLDDLSTMDKDTVFETVKMRWDGLNLLRKTLGDKVIDLKPWGGYEVFDDVNVFERCMDAMEGMNKEMKDVIKKANCYKKVNSKINEFGFKKIKGMILNNYEAQIDSGKMMNALMKKVRESGVMILNGINVISMSDNGTVSIETNAGEFTASKVVVATNGFAKSLLKIKDVNPARAQVLITKPIDGLKIKGTFHYQQGYYYFRNINGRLLFGGGRNLDFKGETTDQFAVTKPIQDQLEKLLKEVILPNTKFQIEHRWAGIMGVGKEKKPIIQAVSKNVIAAVRMGGMGVAIGSLVGKKAAQLANEK